LQIGVELVRRGLAGVTKANRFTLLRNRAEGRPRQMPGALLVLGFPVQI
jgi:hypothetical protein